MPRSSLPTPPSIKALYRYPVKGLSPERLSQVALGAGQGFPWDRTYAITNGTWEFSAEHYVPRPKGDFLMLRDHEALALLDLRINEHTETIVVRARDGSMVQAALSREDELQELAQFVAQRCGKPLTGQPRFVQAKGQRFTDAAAHSPLMMHAVSAINLASLRELESALGCQLDPRRFRANVYFDGAPAWSEHDWLEREVHMGSVRLRGLHRIRRCAAVNVNLETGTRDQGIPQALLKHFGHVDLGVYLEVLSDGEMAPGDEVVALKQP